MVEPKASSINEGKSVLVTGATGLVGGHLVARLLKQGYRVRGMTRSAAKARELERTGCEAVVGDVRDDRAVAQAVAGVRGVIHLVAILRPWRDATYESVTVQGTRAVVAAAQRSGVRRLIYISALGVRAADTNPYMASKRKAEEAVRASGLDYTILRPSYLYGQGSHFLKLLEQLVTLPVIPVVGPGRQRLQIMWVADLVACIVASLGKEATYRQTYEIGGPEALTFNEVLDILSRVKGKRPRPKIHLPYALILPFAAVGAKLIPTLPATPETLELLLRDNICDVRYVPATFGVRLTPFAEALKRMLR